MECLITSFLSRKILLTLECLALLKLRIERLKAEELVKELIGLGLLRYDAMGLLIYLTLYPSLCYLKEAQPTAFYQFIQTH